MFACRRKYSQFQKYLLSSTKRKKYIYIKASFPAKTNTKYKNNYFLIYPLLPLRTTQFTRRHQPLTSTTIDYIDSALNLLLGGGFRYLFSSISTLYRFVIFLCRLWIMLTWIFLPACSSFLQRHKRPTLWQILLTVFQQIFSIFYGICHKVLLLYSSFFSLDRTDG